MDLIAHQFLASHIKNYPGGVPKHSKQRDMLRVVFYSDLPISSDEKTLLDGAAQKGLRLGSADYVICTGGELPQCEVVISLGSSRKFEGVQVVSVKTAQAIFASPAEKKIFWDQIKPFVRE